MVSLPRHTRVGYQKGSRSALSLFGMRVLGLRTFHSQLAVPKSLAGNAPDNYTSSAVRVLLVASARIGLECVEMLAHVGPRETGL